MVRKSTRLRLIWIIVGVALLGGGIVFANLALGQDEPSASPAVSVGGGGNPDSPADNPAPTVRDVRGNWAVVCDDVRLLAIIDGSGNIIIHRNAVLYVYLKGMTSNGGKTTAKVGDPLTSGMQTGQEVQLEIAGGRLWIRGVPGVEKGLLFQAVLDPTKIGC